LTQVKCQSAGSRHNDERLDSRECRNRHPVEAKDPRKPPAVQMTVAAMKAGATCIDCHKGIAHQLPAGPAKEPAKK
jgi:trimethylamine-N-oxide reductase (cytochrome c), cytochrome c-type subunit TorC